MKELYELKERLCNELKEYGKKEMSTGSLDVIDKLTHTIKNLDKILEYDEYSNRMAPRYSQRRDSMGRYSGEGNWGY